MTPTKASLIFHAVALTGIIGVTISAGYALPPVVPTYELVMEYRSDRFVIDHDLSIADCVDALPRNDPYRKLSFACELED